MARKTRINLRGATYHVVLRGNQKQDIFFCPDDAFFFFELLSESHSRFGTIWRAFCLMPNHAHLLLTLQDRSLSELVQNLSFRYTKWVNSQHSRSGHLFRGRFDSLILDPERYLLDMIRFIHLNPVRAGIVTDPVHFRWSSHRYYLDMDSLPWLDPGPVLEKFGKTLASSIETYRAYVLDKLHDDGYAEFCKGHPEDSRILGDSRFIQWVHSQMGESNPESIRIRGEDLLDAVLKHYSLTMQELCHASKDRVPSEARGVASYLVQKTQAVTLTELGRRVKRNVTTLSHASRRIRARVKQDPRLARRIQEIERELI